MIRDLLRQLLGVPPPFVDVRGGAVHVDDVVRLELDDSSGELRTCLFMRDGSRHVLDGQEALDAVWRLSPRTRAGV